VIRVNPHEVHIADPSYLDTIYATRNRNDPTAAGGLLVERSVGGCVDFATHRVRRDALNPYFTRKNVLRLEPLLREKTGFLQECLESALQKDSEVNLSDHFFAFSNE
jgi:cytochrome P450